MNSIISLKDFSKEYAGNLVLNAINLEFADSGLVLLLGANAAGKSTLLKSIAGLLLASNGQLQTDSKVAYFGHAIGLYPNLTVKENLSLFQNLEIVDSALLEKYVLEFELSDLLKKSIAELSQGQRARVNLARVFAAPGEWPVLLDEPGANLDVSWSNKLLKIVETNLQTRLILLVTHDPQKYYNLASRVVVMQAGKVVYDQTTDNASVEQVQSIYLEQLK